MRLTAAVNEWLRTRLDRMPKRVYVRCVVGAEVVIGANAEHATKPLPATRPRMRARHQERFQNRRKRSGSENALPSVLSRSLPALPPPLRNELAAAGVLGGVAVGAGGSPDTGSARSGSRCAIRSLLRSSVTGHGGGRTAQSNLLLVRSSVLAPSSGRRGKS